QGLGQVINGPVLATGRVRVPTQHIPRTVRPQFVGYVLHLTLAQFRSHWSTPMVAQSFYPVLAIFATPFHQACPMAARDLADRPNPILLSIQPNSLIARPFAAISTVTIGPLQFFVLFLRQFKSSLCHPSIVCLCSEFSISSCNSTSRWPGISSARMRAARRESWGEGANNLQ